MMKKHSSKLCPCDGCKPDSGRDVDLMRIKRSPVNSKIKGVKQYAG